MSEHLHALSFDVEEYFQVANFTHHFRREDWDRVASRLDVGMDRILGALEPAERQHLVELLLRGLQANAAYARPGAGRRKPVRARKTEARKGKETGDG